MPWRQTPRPAAEPVRELFVYYRVAAAQTAAAGRCVNDFQAALCDANRGLRARRMLREPAVDPGSDEPTWMEIYAIDPSASKAGITPSLQAAIEDAAAVLQPFLRGPRHCEVFVPCAS